MPPVSYLLDDAILDAAPIAAVIAAIVEAIATKFKGQGVDPACLAAAAAVHAATTEAIYPISWPIKTII
jgi:hypothetical protein